MITVFFETLPKLIAKASVDFSCVPVQKATDFGCAPAKFMTLQEAIDFSTTELKANKTQGTYKIGGVDYHWHT